MENYYPAFPDFYIKAEDIIISIKKNRHKTPDFLVKFYLFFRDYQLLHYWSIKIKRIGKRLKKFRIAEMRFNGLLVFRKRNIRHKGNPCIRLMLFIWIISNSVYKNQHRCAFQNMIF